MATRSILGLMYILQGMQDAGIDVQPALAQFGLSKSALDPTAQIERQLEREIHIALAKLTPYPHAGLAIGQYFSLAGYGALVMLLLTCRDLKHAVETGVTYQQLTFLFGHLRFEHAVSRSALVLTPPDLPEPARRFRLDGEMAGTFKLIRDLSATFNLRGKPPETINVELPIAQPTDPAVLAEYQAYYGDSVSFGHTEGRFWASHQLLSLPLMTADPVSHALYRQQCDRALVTQQTDTDDLIAKIRAYLLLQQHIPNISMTAQALNRPERTLRYQLSQRGCSFRQLRDQLRFEQAKRLLLQHPHFSVEQISEQLGYAESAAFIHAFVRWSGTTPARYRREST